MVAILHGYQIRLPLAIQNLMLFEEFQDCPPSWILELNNSAILSLRVTQMPPIKFWLNRTVLEEGHLGHWNRRITCIAILNFHNTPMPHIMFKFNQTDRSVANVI